MSCLKFLEKNQDWTNYLISLDLFSHLKPESKIIKLPRFFLSITVNIQIDEISTSASVMGKDFSTSQIPK